MKVHKTRNKIVIQNLKDVAISGIQWTALATIITSLIQFVQLAVLARLLNPRDFGLVAIVIMIVDLFSLIAEMGLSAALIQRREIKQSEISSLYWLNVLVGLLMFVFMYIFSPIFAKFFDSSELKSLLSVTSLIFIITPISSLYGTLLQKEFQFKILTIIESVVYLLSFIITISLAFSGFGVWSLIYGPLAGKFINMIALAYFGWNSEYRPQFYFNFYEIKSYLSFGLYRVGAMAANQLNSRIDQIVIATLLGPVQLGYYNIAFRLAIQPIQKINPILTKVAFPVFSAAQDDLSRLKRGYMKMIRMLMTVNAPILIGLSATAHIVVPLFLGEQWIPAIGLVQILALYSLVRSLGNAGGSLICASGHADWTFYWNVSLLFLIPAVLFGAGYSGSAATIAMALLGLQILLFFAHYAYFIRKIIGPCFSEYIFNIGRPVMIAAAMGGSLFFFRFLFPPSLILLLISGGTLYIILSWLFNKESMEEFIHIMPFSNIKKAGN